MSEDCRLLDQFVEDFRAAMECSHPRSAFTLDSFTVPCWFRYEGNQRISSENDAVGLSEERGDVTVAFYIAAEAELPDGTPRHPLRGEDVVMNGARWQVRENIPYGFGEGQIRELRLTRNLKRGPRSGR